MKRKLANENLHKSSSFLQKVLFVRILIFRVQSLIKPLRGQIFLATIKTKALEKRLMPTKKGNETSFVCKHKESGDNSFIICILCDWQSHFEFCGLDNNEQRDLELI